MFSYEFCKIPNNTLFLHNTSGRLLLQIVEQHLLNSGKALSKSNCFGKVEKQSLVNSVEETFD